jgi:hypothetical protein
MIEHEIMQAQASLELAERMFRNRRGKETEVLQARALLNELLTRKNVAEKSTNILQTSSVVFVGGSVAPKTHDLGYQSQLLGEADSLKKQMSELSNQLHCASDEELKVLLPQIGALNVLKEKKWTEYRFFQRNGVKLQDDRELVEAQVKPEELLQLEEAKRSWMQKRSKARKVLDEVVMVESKRLKYVEKVALCDAEIGVLDEKIKGLK